MSSRDKRQVWLQAFNTKEDFPFKYIPNSTKVYCKICEKQFSGEQKSHFSQHLGREIHQRNAALKANQRVSQALLEDVVQPKEKASKAFTVASEITEAFSAASIPWYKIQHPKIRALFERHIGVCLPTEANLCQTHLPAQYEKVMEIIRNDLSDGQLWICTDETTDAVGRYVVNVMIGKLDANKYHPPHLVHCDFLERPDGASMARFVNQTINSLFPHFDADRLRVFITDGAPYMIKCGGNLKIFYPKLLHVTCLCHALHRLAECVREEFEDVNELISTVKKVFLKAPSRQALWREVNQDLQLPKCVVLTR